MKISEYWPTSIGHVNIKNEKLLEHIILSYNFSEVNALGMNPKGENIFDSDKSKVMIEFQKTVKTHLSHYIKSIYNCTPKKLKLVGWLTGNMQGYSLMEHNHNGAQFTATYYALAESKNKGGEIHFSDPRTNANRGYSSEYTHIYKPVKHEPVTGDLLIFPGFLYHYVSAYHQNNRIALTIDVFIEE